MPHKSVEARDERHYLNPRAAYVPGPKCATVGNLLDLMAYQNREAITNLRRKVIE